MGGVTRVIVILMGALVMAVLPDETSGQVLPLPHPRESARPLCISQLALANQACATIPFSTVTHTSAVDELAGAPAPGPRPAIDQLYHKRRHHRRHKREDEGEDEGEHDHDHDHDHEGSHEHEGSHQHGSHRHRSKRGNHEHNRNHNHHHHGSHHKRKVGRHHGTEECCRWLKAMDDRCVCTLLLRLPAFLSGPAHGYTVSVDDDCEVEFECPGRFMQS